MSYFNKLDNARGGYIFLSHSHDDIKKVRELRNLLEEKGFEPLCFYLKCLTDDSEIEDLIKREIDAREWFLFVNSANSRKSKWVTLEREYITKTDSKKIISIDIDDVQDVRAGTEKILHNLRVFLSYSSKDVALARRINDKLVKKDYLVFFGDNQNLSNDAYLNEGINMLCQAAREGCVLVLLSMNSIQSPWVREELKSALLSGGSDPGSCWRYAASPFFPACFGYLSDSPPCRKPFRSGYRPSG